MNARKYFVIALLLSGFLGGCNKAERPRSGSASSPEEAGVSGAQAEGTTPETLEAYSSPGPVPEEQAHQDHNSKRNGVFFMALDGKHHLEGVLIPPRTFRIYLYDAYTRPLTPEQTKKARGTVQWGEAEDSQEVPLKLADDGRSLESVSGREFKCPITLTLLLRFPDSPVDARPEVFTFPFRNYTNGR